MNYVHAPLISAHANLISAPRAEGYDPIDEQIKIQRLIAMQKANAAPMARVTPVETQVKSATGNGTVQRVRVSSGSESAQEQLQKAQSQEALRRFIDDRELTDELRKQGYWGTAEDWRREQAQIGAERRAENRQIASEQRQQDYQLTAQGRREKAALTADVVDAIKAGKFSSDELPQLIKEYGIAEDTIRLADTLREREPTAADRFRRNTYTNDDGVVFSGDGKLLYNPHEISLKRQDAEDKRYQDALLKLGQGRRVTKEIADENGDKSWQTVYEPYSEDEKEEMLRKMFPRRFPKVEEQKQETGDPIVVSPLDPMNPQNYGGAKAQSGTAAAGENTAAAVNKDGNATVAQDKGNGAAEAETKDGEETEAEEAEVKDPYADFADYED